MIRKFISLLLFTVLISGCSKENKTPSGDIKIEQQNPPLKKESTIESTKVAIKDSLKTDAQMQSDGRQVPQEPEKLSLKSKQASKHIGKNATINGYVADVYKNEKVAYLNFDAKFPKNTFSGVIFKDDFSKFGDINRFRNKNVEISGIISEYNGKPQIILKNTSQVKITN